MKKRILTALLALLAALLLGLAASAEAAPLLDVDAAGTVRCAAGEGRTLYLASYDPDSGQFLGLLHSGSHLNGTSLLKAMQTDAQGRPVSAARSVLVLAEGGSYRGGTYDAVVITARARGAVRLTDMEIGDLRDCHGGDLELDGVTVRGELCVAGPDAALSAEGGQPSIRIRNRSGVGSIRVMQTADGGIQIRTEEGCRVDWVLVEDGRGEILLEGDFHQVVLDTDHDAAVVLDGATVSGLTINGQGADVTLQGETSVVSVEISEDAENSSLMLDAEVEASYVHAAAGDVSISGAGTVVCAEVSGDGCAVDTVGTWLSVAPGTTGVTENGSGVAAGSTVLTGAGGSGGGAAQPEEHTHVWRTGVSTGADPEHGGTVVCVCTVCGETFSAPISDRPFAVTYQVSADGSVRETQRFDTLEEALACAQAHSYEVSGDGAPMLLCPEIDLIGDAVVEVLRIPMGNTLIVGNGGGLTLLGDIRTGSARSDAAGRFSPPGHLVVPVEEGCANRLALGDQVLYDGADPDAGAIVAEPDGRFQWGAHRDNIRIGGGWTDMPDEVTPQLILDGEEGEDAPCPANCYRIQKDLDLRGWVTGIQIGNEDRVRIAARVQVPTVWHWGEDGEFYLCDSGAALLMDAYSVGLAADCNVELRPAAGRADKPIVGLENPERLQVVGGDVVLRGEGFVLPELEVRGWDEADETEYTITVEQGATVRLADRSVWLNRANALVNEGTLELTDRLCMENAVLVNRGTLRIGVRQTDTSERPEDNYAIGALELWGAEARLDNEGLLQLDCERFTNSYGDEDGRYGELYLSSGAVLNNGAAAMLDNSGFCYVRGAATLNNQGVLRNRELVRLELGEAGWVSYDGGAETLDQINGPSVLNNTGSLINSGRLEVQGSRLESSGVLSNQGDLWLDPAEDVKLLVYLESVAGEPQTEADWADFRGFRDAGHWWRRVREERTTLGTLDPALVLGGGSFTNGGVTGVGDGDNGGWADFHMRGGTLENGATLVNSGSMGLEDTAYRQSAGAKLSNYNAAGLEFRGGSITVPKGGWFKNEGYMRIVDRYGADYSPCDLEGFPDFFTVWNQDGNDSNWCEFTAEVYDFAGYQQAAEVQRERTETNPASRYNRLDFCADVTVTADTRFADFGSYWINSRSEERWRIWDGAQNAWVELDGQAEGAESYWVRVGNTLTVAKGATLTIAPDNVLRVDGENGMMTECSPNRLVVLGTLVTEPEVAGTEDNDWQRQEEGLVEIWSFGSFDASRGRVDNRGRFEIRYYDMGHGAEEDGGFVYVHEGRLERPADCPVLGAPANACCAAEVRSAAGFGNAVNSQTPAFYRLYIREDCCVTLTEDRNVPQGINIEPGSGLIVAHGAALTAGGHIWNDGDLSVYGDLILNGGLDNNQNLEVGALSGSQQGRILLHGSLQIRSHAAFTVYPTGSVLLYDGSEFRNETEDPDRRTRVTLAGQPWYVRGAVLPELDCISGVTFETCLFEGPVTVHATADGAYAFVNHCVFRKDVSLDAGDGSRRLQVTFDGNADFAGGKRVLVRCDADADLERLLHNNVDLGGVNGLTVDCPVSAWINPGWIGEDASYVVNGVRVEHHILHGGTVEGGVSLRFEPTDEGIWRVFQVDSSECCEVALRDTLEGYDELRLMQGNIDISALETGDAYIHITDPWSYTLVDIGAHAVTLWENQDGDRHGFGVRAAAGAEITVRGACMDWDGQENWYGYTTGVNLSTGERETWLSPHIFGARYGSPAVFIGIDDSAVQYQLEYQGQVLPFTRELLPDGDHGKTHLNPVAGQPWFEAGPDYDPMLVMTITLPEGVRVVFDPVPVKPDWMEPEG